MRNSVKEKSRPFILTAFVILADQLVKGFIVKNWPKPGRITDVFNNGILEIYHVRNKAIAFSLGSGIPNTLRPVLFIIVPLFVLGILVWYYFVSGEFNRLQRWAVAGIIGGGLGNIIDRIFRPDGVVDFISVKFYGLFGMERWPTFNIADSSVVICCIILFISILVLPKNNSQREENHEQES
jgi:signal peptidase II